VKSKKLTNGSTNEKKSWWDTFIPGIWTHSTAVPVALERNSAKVSSAMDKSLGKRIRHDSISHKYRTML